MDDFPTDGVALTHLLVVGDVDRARDFYCDVLGAEVYREYGGDSCVLQFQGAWLLLVTGGGPTDDKPGVRFAPPSGPDEVLRQRGAEFLTPPMERPGEVRCFFRDPDGHLLEISESR